MKILQVHNYYQIPGGEDMVVSNEKELLTRHGHQVLQYTRHNDEIKGVLKKVKLLLSTHYSHQSKKLFQKEVERVQPDVVHVHNFFPLITPSVFDVCQSLNIPSVLTLHNYRLLHPNGYLMDNNCKIDERSVKGSAYECVKDGVYRNSLLQTAVVAHMIEHHRRIGTWQRKVGKFIALTNFARQKFIEGGLPANKIVVKPNFIQEYLPQKSNIKAERENYFLFVGRISPEKGIDMLLKTWMTYNTESPLYIIGQGPMEESVRQASIHCKRIAWLGRQNHAKVMEYISRAKALIFPSVWYEGFPMTIVEAFALGTPIISSNIGGQAEIVTDGYNGLHFEMANVQDLYEKASQLTKDKELVFQLGQNARETYLDNFTPEKNYENLMHVYQETTADNNFNYSNIKDI